MSTPTIQNKPLTSALAAEQHSVLSMETSQPEITLGLPPGKVIGSRFRPETPSDEVISGASLMFDQIANWQDGNKDAVAEALKGVDIAAAWAYASGVTSPHHPDEGEKVSLSEMKYFLIAN